MQLRYVSCLTFLPLSSEIDCILRQRTFKNQISEPVELHLNKPTPTMWDKILSTFRDRLDKAEESYLKKAKSASFASG